MTAVTTAEFPAPAAAAVATILLIGRGEVR